MLLTKIQEIPIFFATQYCSGTTVSSVFGKAVWCEWYADVMNSLLLVELKLHWILFLWKSVDSALWWCHNGFLRISVELTLGGLEIRNQLIGHCDEYFMVCNDILFYPINTVKSISWFVMIYYFDPTNWGTSSDLTQIL